MQTLKELRLSRGYTTTEELAVMLAKQNTGCKVQAVAINRWEKGTVYPSGPCILALLNLYDINQQELTDILNETQQRGDK